MSGIKKICYKFAGGVGVISAIGYLFIIVLCVADVILEKLLNAPILGSYELVERSMVVAVFASFAYAQTKKAHINIPILIERFPRLLRLLSLGLTSVVSICVAFYVGYAAWTQAMTTMQMNQVTGVLKIPLFPFFFVESIAMFIFGVILIIDTVLIFGAIRNDRLNEEISSEYGLANMKDM